MKLRKALASAALGAAIAVAPVVTPGPALIPAAIAVAPLDNITSQITDQTGSLAGRQADIQAAFDQVSAQTPFRLYVVFVDSFSGLTGAQWADQTAEASGLGPDDILLAVALDDGEYRFSLDDDAGVTNAQFTAVDNATLAALDAAAQGNGDWADAPIAFANTLLTATGHTPGAAAPAEQPQGGGADTTVEEPEGAAQAVDDAENEAAEAVEAAAPRNIPWRIVIPVGLAVIVLGTLAILWSIATRKRKRIEERKEIFGY